MFKRNIQRRSINKKKNTNMKWPMRRVFINVQIYLDYIVLFLLIISFQYLFYLFTPSEKSSKVIQIERDNTMSLKGDNTLLRRRNDLLVQVQYSSRSINAFIILRLQVLSLTDYILSLHHYCRITRIYRGKSQNGTKKYPN